MNQILSVWTPSQWATSCGLCDHTAGGFGTQLRVGVQPSENRCATNRENFFSISSRSDSASSISHLLSLSCQRFPPLQLIHPHRVLCLHGCAVSEESGKPSVGNRNKISDNSRRDLLICHKYYEPVTFEKMPQLAAI